MAAAASAVVFIVHEDNSLPVFFSHGLDHEQTAVFPVLHVNRDKLRLTEQIVEFRCFLSPVVLPRPPRLPLSEPTASQSELPDNLP